MGLSETLVIALVTALVNGAITWGVVSTKLEWLRADVDRANRRLDALGAPQMYQSPRKHQR